MVGEMQNAITFAAGVAECEVETRARKSYRGYRFAKTDAAVVLAARALERCGFERATTGPGGAADANVFNERGLQCVNLANGMADIHTPDEHIAVADLEAMVEVTLAPSSRSRWPRPPASLLPSPRHEDRCRQGDQAGRVPGRADTCRSARIDPVRPRGVDRDGRRHGIAFPDDAYERVGARIVSVDDVWEGTELLLKVKEPVASEYRRLREGLTSSRICTSQPTSR